VQIAHGNIFIHIQIFAAVKLFMGKEDGGMHIHRNTKAQTCFLSFKNIRKVG
jgi:hypothetical protein